MNRSVRYLHIPKCGGTYIGYLLYGEEVPHDPLGKRFGEFDDKYDMIFTSIREPLSFYKSMFRFFRNNRRKKIVNKMADMAKRYDDINDFTNRLLDGNLEWPTEISAKYDVHDGRYGLLTHYLRWFTEPFLELSDDAKDFVREIKNGIHVIRMEYMDGELNELIRRYDMGCNKGIIERNESEPNIAGVNYEFTKETIERIYDADRYIYYEFYS